MRALRIVAFALFPTLLLFGVFSLGFLGEPENDPWLTASPLWGPGDPFYFEEHELAHNLADPILIWRGRPNFEASYQYLVLNPYTHNEYGFRDAPIADPKPRDVVRVLNLGDSSTWGLNLPEQEATYSDQLQRILDDEAGGAPRYDVVNAGVVGYSSFQGLQLLRHWLDELDADVVSIYLGNNDPAPSSVKDVDRVAATAGPLHDALYRNRFYLLLVKGFQSLRAAGIDRERRRLGSLSEDQALEDYYRVSARVSPDEFEDNLRGMVAEVRDQGAQPILLKVPMNLAWPHRVQPYVEQILRPDRFWGTVKIEPGYLVRVRAGKPPCFLEGLVGHPYLCRITTQDLEKARLPDPETLEAKAADPALGERARLWAAHNRAVWELAGGDPREALARFQQVAAGAEACDCVEAIHRAWIQYNLGIARLVVGDGDAAFAAITESRRIWPFAMSPDYEARFDRVVADLDVPWVDLPERFRETDPRFFGSTLIHDWVHPNAAGNAVIARALAEKLRELR